MGVVKNISVESLGSNDTRAKLVSIEVKDGSFINKGDVVCCLETTKAVYDIESPSVGYIAFISKIGDNVVVDQTLALLLDDGININSEIKKYKSSLLFESKKIDSIKITKKAESLAKEYGVDIQSLAGQVSGLIREKDILNSIKLNNKDFNEFNIDKLAGKLNSEFIKQISNDKSFSLLPSSKKIDEYRKNGAIIGENVEIGHGTILICSYLDLKDGSKIGSNCYIKTFSFELGRMSVIGNNANIVTRHIRIGDVFFSGESIVIGGGGAFSPRAYLIIGDSCLVSSNCLLNTGEGISIGDEVGLSPNVKLYTHSHWQSELDGYFSNFGPIIVNDKVYITGDSIVVPNVTIGEGATVFANSTVVGDVDSFTQVVGNPASVIRKVNTNLSIEQKDKVLSRIILDIDDELIKTNIIVNKSILYKKDFSTSDVVSLPSIILTLNFSNELKSLSKGLIIFDMIRLKIFGKEDEESDEVRNFLRRRGIRFKPIYWRYEGDTGLYNG